jgi:hypothetical protein
MIINLNKKYYIRIYSNQLNGSLLLNGKNISSESSYVKMFINFLESLSLSINIIFREKRGVRHKSLSQRLLLQISSIINNRFKKNVPLRNYVPNLDNNNNKEKKYFYIFKFVKILMFFILILLIVIFIFDYKKIESKINHSNEYEIKKVESDYKINKCEINGELSSLKQKCQLMLNQIEILKTTKPSLLSVLCVWILDIFNSFIMAFSLKNSIIIITMFGAFFKIFNLFKFIY